MFSERLKLARKREGLSLRDLASRIDGVVSAQAIGKYERGEMIPSSTVSIALSKVLGVSMSYLLSPSDVSLEGVEFRKLASTKARERAMVEGAVLDYVDRYLQVEQLLDISSAQWEEPKEELFDEVGRRRHALGYAELIEIKQMFGVSAAALVVRLRDLGIITEATLRGVFSGVGRGWRKVEPDPLERDEPTRRFRRLCFRALAEEAISESKAAELLGLPVSEIERIMSGPAG